MNRSGRARQCQPHELCLDMSASSSGVGRPESSPTRHWLPTERMCQSETRMGWDMTLHRNDNQSSPRLLMAVPLRLPCEWTSVSYSRLMIHCHT